MLQKSKVIELKKDRVMLKMSTLKFWSNKDSTVSKKNYFKILERTINLSLFFTTKNASFLSILIFITFLT